MATDSRLPATYLTALASYRAGDPAVAFGKLQELGESEVTEITWAPDAPRRGVRIELAAARRRPSCLHTEAFLIREEAGPWPTGDVYLLTAYPFVRRLLALAREGQPGIGESERILARDGYPLLASVQHGRADIGRSRAFSKRR